ncbi:hypothetical protein MLD52_13700 [Puniceicoccaceae bacterium K14]|nr:hypothetical protein [Puniceicoccaceae bacterium K14]
MFQPAAEGPSDEELAEYYGAPKAAVNEDEIADESDSPLIPLDQAKNLIPAKSRALMHELFRAELLTVKRFNPKKLR